MKTYQVSEEFIKEAHGAACGTWKSKIEKEFPELFKSVFEIGKWYIDNDGNIVHHGGQFKDYAVRYGEWIHEVFWLRTEPEGFRLATDEEVESALIEEAKKRGYKEGDNIGNFNGIENEKIGMTTYIYIGGLLFLGGACIFDSGKWAEIIPSKKEMTLAEVEKELGYSIKLV